MNKRVRYVGGLLLVVVAVLIAACGGDDEDSIEAYFADVETAKAQLDADQPADLFQTSGQETVDLLRAEAEVLRSFADSLDDLEAPDSVSEEHDLAVALTRERVSVQEEIAGSWLQERTTAEFNEYLAIVRPQREGTRELWHGAVCALERHATDEGIGVELGCSLDESLALRRVDREEVVFPTGPVLCELASEPEAEYIAIGQVILAQWFNERDQPVRLYRIERSGERDLVVTLAPGESSIEPVLIGTGWIATDEEDDCFGGFHPPRDLGSLNIHIR